MFAFFKNFQNLRKPSKTPVCLGGGSRFCQIFFKQREPRRVILCLRVTLRSKERETSPLHADVFLITYMKLWMGEICSSPTQILQDFTAISCQRTIVIHISKTLEAPTIPVIYKARTSDSRKSFSHAANLVHASLPAQAMPVVRQIPLLQVKTREKKSHEKWLEEEKSMLVRLWAENFDYLESKDARRVWERIARELSAKCCTKKTSDKCQKKM